MIEIANLLRPFIFFAIFFWSCVSGQASSQKSSTSEPAQLRFELQVHRMLELANSARAEQLIMSDWPEKRVADLYDPSVCIFNERRTEARDQNGSIMRSDTVDQIYANSQIIRVNSPEFHALSVQVDPVEGLEFSCDETRCLGIIPYDSSVPNRPKYTDILVAENWVRLPLIQNDVCVIAQNWCALDRRECVSKGTYYYHRNTRTLLRVDELQFGRRRHSLQFEFQDDSDPICQDFTLQIFASSESLRTENEAYLSLCGN